MGGGVNASKMYHVLFSEQNKSAKGKNITVGGGGGIQSTGSSLAFWLLYSETSHLSDLSSSHTINDFPPWSFGDTHWLLTCVGWAASNKFGSTPSLHLLAKSQRPPIILPLCRFSYKTPSETDNQVLWRLLLLIFTFLNIVLFSLFLRNLLPVIVLDIIRHRDAWLQGWIRNGLTYMAMHIFLVSSPWDSLPQLKAQIWYYNNMNWSHMGSFTSGCVEGQHTSPNT